MQPVAAEVQFASTDEAVGDIEFQNSERCAFMRFVFDAKLRVEQDQVQGILSAGIFDRDGLPTIRAWIRLSRVEPGGGCCKKLDAY